MLRVLPYLIAVALVIYCLIDAIQVPSSSVRVLPRLVWFIVIIVIPFLGPIAWLVAGRPARPPRASSSTSSPVRRAPLGPDDDPDYLRKLSDQARREREARERAADGDTDGDSAPPTGSPGPTAPGPTSH